MRTGIWYRTELKNPDKSGHYLAYRGWGMGGKADSDHDHGYMYYDKKTNQWYEYSDKRDTAIVYYWTDATPDEWTDADPPSVQLRKVKEEPNPALEIAWKNVEEAVRQYHIVESLVR